MAKGAPRRVRFGDQTTGRPECCTDAAAREAGQGAWICCFSEDYAWSRDRWTVKRCAGLYRCRAVLCYLSPLVCVMFLCIVYIIVIGGFVHGNN